MEMTVKHMKLGSKLVLGRYGVRSTDEPDPIVWQKATPKSRHATATVRNPTAIGSSPISASS